MGRGETFKLLSFQRKAQWSSGRRCGLIRTRHFLRIRWELIDFVSNNWELPLGSAFSAPAGMGVIFQRSAQAQTQGHHQEEEKEEIQSRNIGCELWNSFPLSWFKRPSCRCLTNSTTVLDFTSVVTFFPRTCEHFAPRYPGKVALDCVLSPPAPIFIWLLIWSLQ